LTSPFFGLALLKIRGDRGVIKIIEITPFIPLTSRGRFKKRALSLRGGISKKGPPPPLIFDLNKS
jgi:hypothetical protein